jgi:hypothetical protein
MMQAMIALMMTITNKMKIITKKTRNKKIRMTMKITKVAREKVVHAYYRVLTGLSANSLKW